jgi:hypothetical protein
LIVERVFFEERQKLPGHVVWIVIFTAVAMCVPLLRGLYFRLVLNEPWGNGDFSNKEICLALAFVVGVSALVVWLLVSMNLVVKIDSAGITYRSFPGAGREKRVTRQDIHAYEVRKLKWNELVQSTKSRRLLQQGKSQIHRFSGKTGLVLKLADGVTIILGTTNPDGMIWAMKKLMSPS